MHAGCSGEEGRRFFIGQTERERKNLVTGRGNGLGKHPKRIERDSLGEQPVIKILSITGCEQQPAVVVSVGLPLDAPLGDAVQGFYFSKPLPADKCLEWILARTRANRGTSGTYLAPDVALAPANDGTRKVS